MSPSNEYHVASFVVYANPEQADSVANHVDGIPGMEVHASESGKLVVTAEGDHLGRLADQVSELHTVPGVVSVAPVYHEVDQQPEPSNPSASSDS